MKKQRYDKALIEDFSETPEGFLTVKAPITRPGVFPYMRSDGGIQMEAKLPDEIFSDRTVRSAMGKPVTDDHPNELVTLENYQTYSKGMTHTDAQVSGNKLNVSMTITDADLIKKIKSGKRELSIGFMSDVAMTPGEYNGAHYDAVQRNVEINHVAVVDRGRAGPTVAIRGDAAQESAYMVDSADPNKGGKNMAKYKIDGNEYEVEATIKARLDSLEAQLDAANTKAANADKLQGSIDALQAKFDAKETELVEAKKQNLTQDELDAKVESRVGLISDAKPYLGDEFDFKGKADRAIKEAVITKINADFKGDSKSDDYVNAYYDSMLDLAKKEGFHSDGANNLKNFNGIQEGKKKIDKSRSDRMNIKAMNMKSNKQC
ncbi:MAG: DUF2213 domain-containing protein [Sporolactobacillus sp.]